MATNGANINNPANLQAYVAPAQAEPRIETQRTVAPAKTTQSHTVKQRGLVKDEFQKADVKQDAVRDQQQQTARVQRHSPEQAQQLAEKIANNSIATGNAAIIAQPNTQRPEDKKTNKDIEYKIAGLMLDDKEDEALALIDREVKLAFANRDIDSANKWMLQKQKVRTGKFSLPTPYLVADGQMSSNYARGLSSDSETADLLNNIASTPGAGSVADAKLASFLRNKAGAERMAPPDPTYSPRVASATERATALASALSLVGSAPWDSKKVA